MIKTKALIAMVIISLCQYTHSTEYKVTFANYFITNNASVATVGNYVREKKAITRFSDVDVELLEKYSSFKEEYSVVTSLGRLDIDTLKPIPFAKKNDDKYEIVNSDRLAGLRCSLKVMDRGYSLYLDGEFQFYSLVERRIFEPFPILDGGEPLIVTGGRNSGLILRPDTCTLGSYILVGRAGGTEKTLSIMLVRYESIANEDKGSVVPPVDLFDK